MKRFATTVSAAAVCLALANPSLAADEAVTQEEIQSAIDVAFGVTLTSNYISRGSTQTDDRAAVQGYVELSYGIVYAGVWASNVSVNGPSEAEVDFYAGIRPEFGDLSLDLGYARYVYTTTGDCCGEIYAKAYYAFTDEFSAGIENYFDPDASTVWTALTGEVALPQDFTLSGSFGTDFGTLGNAIHKNAWDIGISRSFFDEKMTLDLRYHDSDLDPARFVASISFDLSASDLFSK